MKKELNLLISMKMAIAINAVIHSASAAGAFPRVQVFPLKLDTLVALLATDPHVQTNIFRWEKSDLLNTFSSQIETMPSLFKQSRYSTREGIKL